MKKITCIIVGTRPELIKVAPIIFELKKNKIEFIIINTAQHKELLAPYWDIFKLKADYELDVMKPNQSLATLTASVINQLQNLLDAINKNIGLIVAQGDTTTVMVASMIAFYNKIKFAHIEAGLRSFDFENPFPEEYNRRVASICTKFHFAPTKLSASNLLKEGINKKYIYVTGNTVVDSLQFIVKSNSLIKRKFADARLNNLENDKVVLITCHRRENQGKGLQNIIEAVLKIANKFNNYKFVWVLHPNPNVKTIVLQSKLSQTSNCIITSPLDYIELIKLMRYSKFIITDSGGIQEEAPSFCKPIVVLRETTERPEGVELGMAKLCGTNINKIYKAALWANEYKFSLKNNPYGNGNASQKIVAILKKEAIKK
ncbi:MAG: UDP-N-acetylglucosamine 2-epimerase (non-hydrolyzing) [Bacteroidetes bacterium]|nr:UDP-N-acetylglucosamine 2-epimerase (non-hydrolyzing) [Bacteroidota bacterium]